MSDMNFNMNQMQTIAAAQRSEYLSANIPKNDDPGQSFALKIEATDGVNTVLAAARGRMGEGLMNPDKPENQVLSFIDRSMESLSEANKKLRDHAAKMAEAKEKLDESFKRDPRTGENDFEKAREAAKDFVKRYNEFTKDLKNTGNGTVESKAKFIGDITDAYGRRLEKVGITKGDDGRLTFDESKFEQAGDRDIERVFGEKDSFAEFMDGQAKQLAAYAQTDLYQRSEAYNDAGNIMQISNISGSYFNMLG